MDWKYEMKYLGVYFLATKVLKCNLQPVRQKYFRALNGLFSKIGTRSSPMVTLSLIDSFCVPLLSYGIESFNTQKSDCGYLDSACNAAFAKLFSSYDKSVISCCQFYCGVLPFSMRIDIRRLQFYVNLSSTNSDTLLGLYLLSGKQEYHNLLNKHGLIIIGDRPNMAGWRKHIWISFEYLIEDIEMHK